MRTTCYRCFRPPSLCYCDHLPSIQNRTRVTVLQHPREQFHPLNTARIVENGLSRSRVLRYSLSKFDAVLQGLDLPSGAAILYPSADAEELESLSASDVPGEIVVLDGTWHHAKTLLRDLPALQKLRRVRFCPPAPSEYRIRKEPREDYLSTVESVAHVLKIIEPETPGLDGLNRCFRHLVDLNLGARSEAPVQGRSRKRTRPRDHRFPEVLGIKPARLVVIYCEGTSRFGTRDGRRASAKADREPLVFVAERLDASSSLHMVMKGAVTPPQKLLNHLAISKGELASQAVTSDEAQQRIQAWLNPDDVLVAWHASSLAIAREIGIAQQNLQLKKTYCDFQVANHRLSHHAPPEHPGALEAAIVRHEIPCASPVNAGRAQLRLTQTRAVLGWLRAQSGHFP